MDTEVQRAPHQDELLLAHLRTFLRDVDAATIDALRRRLQWVELGGGDVLMRQGEAGDSLYMLIGGRLRVYIDDGPGPRMVRDIARGEVVGELSLYTGEPRSATLVAVRDSVLVRLAKDDFDELVAASPELSMALTRQIIGRLRTEHLTTPLDRPVTMALLPVSAGIDLPRLAERLSAELARFGRVGIVSADLIDQRLSHPGLARDAGAAPEAHRQLALLLDEIEATHEFVLLLGDDTPSAWTQRCTRHADELLLLADADAPPVLHPIEERFLLERGRRAEAAEILVLLHRADKPTPRGTRAWLDRRPVSDHLHIRPELDADIARLARIQSRSAVGLVFAGGGARGFAHLGVYRALQERGVPIDFVGGTSIGSVMAAYVASDRPLDAIHANARTAFGGNPTGDVNWLPLLSVLRGRRLRRVIAKALDDLLGFDADLEDLWKNYFCIATNYSQASEQVIRRGNAAKAMRASISIPGALPPVLWDGDLLCDGGTFNNFPVDVMARMRGVKRVIGVDLHAFKPRRFEFDDVPGSWALLRDRFRPRKQRRYRLPSLAAYLMNVTILYSVSRRKLAQAQTDVYFNPPLERVGLLEWGKYEQIVEQGYRHALEVLDRAGVPATS